MKYLLLLILLISPRLSAENYLIVGGWSTHPNEMPNEKHNMIGFETELGGHQYYLTKFTNSFGDKSYMAGVMLRDVICHNKLCLGGSWGLAQGYKFKRTMPIVFGVLSYELDAIGIDVNFIPNVVTELHIRIKENFFDGLNINSPWNTKGYFQISIDHEDPDGRRSWGYRRNNGVNYKAEFDLNDSWSLVLNYTDSVYNSAPDTKHGKLLFNDKLSAVNSQGAIEFWKDLGSYSLGISHNQISLQHNYRTPTELISVPEKHYEGFGIHLRKDYQLTDKLNCRIEVAIIDRFITDLKLTADIKYQLSEQYELVFTMHDWERWNSSQYLMGIRYNF